MPVLLTVVTETPDEARREQLVKIYSDAQPERLAQADGPVSAEDFVSGILADSSKHFYCGLFNERLIAAAVVEPKSGYWQLSQLCVRSVTRRRGVGSRLLTLIIEAARAEQCSLQIAAEALKAPDHIILQRMGYQLSENGDRYQLSLPH